MAVLNSPMKVSNIRLGMQLYLEGKFGDDNPMIVETYADPMGLQHLIRIRPAGKDVFVTEKIGDEAVQAMKTGFEYRLSDETITALMLLVG